jgi:hypothetical protein
MKSPLPPSSEARSKSCRKILRSIFNPTLNHFDWEKATTVDLFPMHANTSLRFSDEHLNEFLIGTS